MSDTATPGLPATPAPAAPALPSGRLLGHVAAFREDAAALFCRAMAVGDVVRMRVAHRTLICGFRPEHVNQVLLTNFNNYSKSTAAFLIARQVMGQGLLTAEGEVWKKHRRIANPAFQQARIASFGATFQRAADDQVRRWEPAVRAGETVDVARALNELTLRIACETLFSMDISEDARTVGDALDTLLSGFMRAETNPLLLKLPLPATRRFWAAVRTLDGIVRGIIARRRAEGGEREDLLGMLTAARDAETGEQLSDDQLRDEVLTMLLAGHETTSTALAWTLYRLSQHPEFDARVGEAGWTELVLKESMRLHPPAWLLSRLALGPDVLGGYAIPAGSHVFLSPYAIHRNPAFWADPERFDPERFLPERNLTPDGQPRPRFAYFPFGAGQRKCIGEHFAMLEASTLLRTIAERYRFELKPGWQVRNDVGLTLRPRGGLPMRITAR